MKKKFSKTWISSIQPRKQRKYRFNATPDIKRTFLSINLAKDLRAKHGVRSVKPRTGDKVKITRGNFKAKTGAIEKIDAKNTKIYVAKIEQTKKDGSKSKVPLHPSNLQIIELNLADKFRKNKLTKKSETKKTDKVSTHALKQEAN